MSLESQRGWRGKALASVVFEGRVWADDEVLSDLQACEVACLPDCKAGWVSEPLLVGLGNVADEVELLGRIVLMDIFSAAVEVITAVLNSPEPANS